MIEKWLRNEIDKKIQKYLVKKYKFNLTIK